MEHAEKKQEATMRTIFSSKPRIGSDATLATASNGRVYIEKGNLHVEYDVRHLVYKYGSNGNGWYRVGGGKDVYLGANCAPTAPLENITVNNKSAWESVIVVPEEREKKTSNKVCSCP